MNQFSTAFSIPSERGKIICPHCGMVLLGDMDSLFITHALSVDQEAEFNATNPLQRAKRSA
jgi:hypothetical protein